MESNINKRKVLIFCVLTGLGVAFYCSRFVTAGIPYYSGQDTFFHCKRLVGLENVWSSPVNFHSFAGRGSYLNLFYPWLTMYPMWILYKLCGSYVLAYKIYYLLLGILTLFLSYWCMKRITADDMAAVCFAALYSLSSYRFSGVFIRGAIGECIAMTFLPVVLLGLYRVFFEDFRKWRTMSVGIALISYSHILSILMVGTVIMLFFFLSFRRWDRRWKRFLSFAKAVTASIGLSLGALLPMAQASLQNKVFHPEGRIETLYEQADNLSSIINTSISNVPSSHSIGLLTMAALCGTLFLLSRGTGTAKKRRIAALFLVFGVLMVMCASSLVPWRAIGHFPLALIIQFPWRLHAYSTLFITAAFCTALLFTDQRNRHRAAVLLCVASVLLTWSSVLTLKGTESSRITEEKIAEKKFEHMDYSPAAFADSLEAGDTEEQEKILAHYYLDGRIVTPESSVSENGTFLYVNLDGAKAGGQLDVPVFWFTTLRARVNGEPVATRMSERGTALVTIPADGDASIEIYHVYTKLAYGSWAFSFVLLLALGATAAAAARRRAARRQQRA